MKFKNILIAGTSVLLSATLVPMTFAQDEGAGFNRPSHWAEHGAGGRPEGAGPQGRGNREGRPGPGGRRGPRPGGNPGMLIEHLDADGDGFVSLEEFLDQRIARADHEFERHDRDGDGLLSEDEARRPERPGHDATEREAVIACVRETIADWEGPADVEDHFDAVDLDGDGYISLVEMSTALEARAHDLFDRIDSNADGLISLEEIHAHQEDEINVRRVVRACIDEISDPFETSL